MNSLSLAFALLPWDGLTHAAQGTAAAAVSGLFSAAWQGAVLAACVWGCLRLFPGLSAAARSVVWMNVFLALVMLHGWPFLTNHALATHEPAGGAARPAFELGVGWSLVVAMVWALLSLFRAVQLAASAVRLRGLARRAQPVEADAAIALLLTVKLGGRLVRRAQLCTTSEVERPSVFGFLHPRILMPPVLMERLTVDELKQVVLHEMEHLKRADDWTNLLQKLALVVFPLNPVLLWVEHRLCAERELACDDSVLRSSCRPKAYAICLTRLAEYTMLRRGLSLALGAWERQSELVRRVHRILRRPAEPMSARRAMALTCAIMAAVLAGAAALAHTQQLVGFKAPVEHVQFAQAKTLQAQKSQAQLASLPVSAYRADVLRAMQLSAPADPGANPGSARMVNAIAREPVAAPKPPVLHRRERTPELQQLSPEQAFAQQAMAEEFGNDRLAAQQQTVMVMTTWSADAVSQQVVFSVAHRPVNTAAMAPGDAQPTAEQANTAAQPSPGKQGGRTAQPAPVQARYAAVPFANGWILVRI